MLLSIFTLSEVFGASSSLSVSDVEKRLNQIEKDLSRLPVRPAHPVGGLRGYKWSKEVDSPWVELHFPKTVTLDSIAVVPLATFRAGQVEPYAMSPKIKVTLLGINKVVFEGETHRPCREANPLFLKFEKSIEQVTGIRVDLLSNQCQAPYLALNEIFAFSKGLNMALGANVKGNSDLPLNDITNHPQNIVNGQSSLGQPVIKTSKENNQLGFRAKKSLAKEPTYIEFLFSKPRRIHEVRLYSLYAPVNDMLLEHYGLGFPVSFRLECINKDGENLYTIHEGSFVNPGRNLATFYAAGQKAAGIKLYVDEYYKKVVSKRSIFNMSEIQIISDTNENLALKSKIRMKGIPSSENKEDPIWRGYLVDGRTQQGKILELENWLKQLALRNTLKLEKESLIQVQGKLLKERTFWFQMMLVCFALVILILFYTWYLSKVRQKQKLNLIRKDIANDLHDEIGSNLASIRLIASRLGSEKPVETINEILNESEESLREMVWALSPQQMLLIEKIKESANRLLPEHQVTFEIVSPEDWEQLDLKDRQHVVFWFKEALNNIQKHAEAKRVDVQLKGNNSSGEFELTVKDDGKGMDAVPYKDDYDHLARLKARTLKLSGEFKVNSMPGKGCEVSLLFKTKNKT